MAGTGWETLFVAIHDHARIDLFAMHLDEKKGRSVQVLRNAVTYYAGQGITIKRLPTDNGAAFGSHEFAAACKAWVYGTSSIGLTGHIRMVRQTDSSSQRYVGGLMAGAIRTQLIERLPWQAGSITPTGTGHTVALAGWRLCRDSIQRKIPVDSSQLAGSL